jgi:hypothetical protein
MSELAGSCRRAEVKSILIWQSMPIVWDVDSWLWACWTKLCKFSIPRNLILLVTEPEFFQNLQKTPLTRDPHQRFISILRCYKITTSERWLLRQLTTTIHSQERCLETSHLSIAGVCYRSWMPTSCTPWNRCENIAMHRM